VRVVVAANRFGKIEQATPQHRPRFVVDGRSGRLEASRAGVVGKSKPGVLEEGSIAIGAVRENRRRRLESITGPGPLVVGCNSAECTHRLVVQRGIRAARVLPGGDTGVIVHDPLRHRGVALLRAPGSHGDYEKQEQRRKERRRHDPPSGVTRRRGSRARRTRDSGHAQNLVQGTDPAAKEM
jgi:hypothetical protein